MGEPASLNHGYTWSRPASQSERLSMKANKTDVLAIVVENREQMHNYILQRVKDSAVADDILQEVHLRMVKKERETTIAEPLAYAYKIARNLIYDHSAKVSVYEPLAEDLKSETPGPADQVNAQRNLAILLEIIRAMPPMRRDIFIRRRLHGQSYQQISVATGLSSKAIEKHISRAIAFVDKRSQARNLQLSSIDRHRTKPTSQGAK